MEKICLNMLNWKMVVILLTMGLVFTWLSPGYAETKPDEVFLWPTFIPGSESLDLQEEVVERSKTEMHDRSVTKILKPSIYVHLPDKEKATGAAVVICPGGAYHHVTIDKEGHDVAKWFNSLGVAAFVLKYRLPGEGHVNREYVPLQDVQRAIRIVRANSIQWNINPQKIGVMGFSAGGHLASTVATHYEKSAYPIVDAKDFISCKPDFAILVYPVITMQDDVTNSGSRSTLLGPDASQDLMDEFSNDLHVTADTPPTFMIQAHDDPVSTENAIRYYLALKKAGVSAEIHIYREGGHGFGLTYGKGPVSNWSSLLSDWLKSLKLIAL